MESKNKGAILRHNEKISRSVAIGWIAWLGFLLAAQKGNKMPMYKVMYGSMTATYGPSYIEANDEYEARRKFAGSAFSQREMPLISARQVSEHEIRNALRRQDERED